MTSRALTGYGTILGREAIRQARRWQTWGLRVALAAVGAALVGSVLWEPPSDVSEIAHVGRNLYDGWSGLVLAVAALLAPVLVAFAIQEELDEGTFDLLTLSGLSSSHVLWGKIGSRLLAVLAVVAGGAPVLGLVTTLGGVSVWEVVDGVVAEATIAITLGTVAGFFALFLRNGPILPTLAALAWAVLAWGILPVLRLLATQDEHTLHRACPFFGPWAQDATGLLPALAAVPVVVGTVRLALPVFRILLTDESTEEFGLLSPEIWVLERYRDAVLGAFFGLGLLTIAGIFALALDLPGRDQDAAEAISWLWLVAAQGVLTPAVLLGAIAARRPLLQIREALLGRRSRRTDGDPSIWGHPVAWRELTGRPYAPPRWLIAGAGILWLLEVVAVGWLDGVYDEEIRDLSAQLIFGSIVAMPFAATLHAIEERRARTLPVLRTTTLTPGRIVLGKLLAVWARTVPWLAAGLLFWSFAAPNGDEWSEFDNHAHGWGPNLLQGSQLARVALTGVWGALAGTLLACVCIAVALRVRTPRAAWGATAAAVFGVGVVIPFGGAVLFERQGLDGRNWLAWFYPWATEESFRCELGGVPRTLVASAGFLGVLCAIAWRSAVTGVARFERDLD